MPVNPEDRPIASLREETIDQLIMNYGHGSLSLEGFERRLDQALDARTHDKLLSLTQDLDLLNDKAYADKKKAEFGYPANTYTEAEDKDEYMIHIFGGSKRTGSWTVAPRIWMINVFGGGDLDFSRARFSACETRIKMFCLFGGANLYVRENINVVSKAVCIFGGIDNQAPSTEAPTAPKLVIEGLLLFGGARICVRKTLRERWLEFADHVRNVLAL